MDDWRSESNCRTEATSLFFTGYPKDEYKAKAICANCPVSNDCLEDALSRNEEFGIWGGLNPQERFNSYLRRALRDRHSISSQHSTPHDNTHLASESPSSQQYISVQHIHTQQVSQKAVVWRGLF